MRGLSRQSPLALKGCKGDTASEHDPGVRGVTLMIARCKRETVQEAIDRCGDPGRPDALVHFPRLALNQPSPGVPRQTKRGAQRRPANQ